MNDTTKTSTPRPPIVTVMGHIDHGKSTLLDYIRKTKVTETEAGGITQHLSAYEVEHTTDSGNKERITFLDTPGHAAFQHLRSRGSSVADLAILVVSAEDGVKPQTLQALSAIQDAGIPYLVAINKIDKPNANVDRTIASLIEHEIYLEGMGGSIPYAKISAKTGEGVPELLDLLLLAAELEELTGDATAPATGLVIESHCDARAGISATLIIKDGTLRQGEYVVAGASYAPLRILRDFKGDSLEVATFSSPIAVVGFSSTPPVGEAFTTVANKKEAEAQAAQFASVPHAAAPVAAQADADALELPVVVKADVVGSLEAVVDTVRERSTDRLALRIVREGVGTVTEGDVKQVVGVDSKGFIVGFNVDVEPAARELAERQSIEIATFSIIYELSEWIENAVASRTPEREVEREIARATVFKVFSSNKNTHLTGGRVESGELSAGQTVHVVRDGAVVDSGVVESLRQGKATTEHIREGDEFGAQIVCNTTLESRDELVAVEKVLE